MLVKREGTEVFGITAYDVVLSTPETNAEWNELNLSMQYMWACIEYQRDTMQSNKRMMQMRDRN